MYSIVLMMAMATPAEVPAGFFNAGCAGTRASASCAGSFATPVRNFFHNHAPVRTAAAFVEAHRPKLLFAGAGCSGATGTSFSRTVTVTRTASRMPVGPAPVAAAVPPAVEGRFVERIVIHRQLRPALEKALADPATPPDKRAAAQKALADPEVYRASVRKVHADLMHKQQVGTAPYGKLGDGTILKMLIDNLPQILEFILKIISALS